MSPDQVILQLQAMMLRAVLLGQPLPGSDQPLRFPDLQFIAQQSVIYLLDNLAGPISLDDLPKPLRTVSLETLREEGKRQGNVAYLQFHVGDVSDTEVNLRLEGRMATGDVNQSELGLSSVAVKFKKVGDEWQVMEEPLYSAA